MTPFVQQQAKVCLWICAPGVADRSVRLQNLPASVAFSASTDDSDSKSSGENERDAAADSAATAAVDKQSGQEAHPTSFPLLLVPREREYPVDERTRRHLGMHLEARSSSRSRRSTAVVPVGAVAGTGALSVIASKPATPAKLPAARAEAARTAAPASIGVGAGTGKTAGGTA
jgi:hypothetical protein